MAKIKKKYEDKPGDWQTIFCSLAIILVAFFVMLCSMATMEPGKVVAISRSFKGAIDIFPGGILFEKGEGVVAPSPDRSGSLQQKMAAPIYHFLRGKGLEDRIVLKSSSDFVSLSIMDRMLFDVNSSQIAERAKPVLKELAVILAGLSAPIIVEGHTDDRMDGAGSKWQLSSMRAVNILKLLQKEGQIPSERLSAAGYAQYRPFLPNKTEEERKRNRRVEIILPILRDYFIERGKIIKDAPPSFKVWDLSG